MVMEHDCMDCSNECRSRIHRDFQTVGKELEVEMSNAVEINCEDDYACDLHAVKPCT